MQRSSFALTVVALLISASASAAPIAVRGPRGAGIPLGPAMARALAARGIAPAGHAPAPRPEILVALDVAPGTRSVPSNDGVEAVLARHGLDHGRPLGNDARFLLLRSDKPGFDPAAAARELRATGRFRAVVANGRVTLHHTIPDDPYLDPDSYVLYQWFIDSPGVDNHLPDAWDIEKGSASTRIGIMDTGVDTIHPDLDTKIWTNPHEIPGNGIDDDGNGYIDDVHGWDFGDNDADPGPRQTIDAGAGIDVGFHGTFVAGLAAAATSNGQGIAGAGWNCSIVPLKVVDSTAVITLASITSAFEYAAAESVHVLNMSFGARGEGVPEYFQALVDMATAARVLCVASAGNDGADSLTYPAGCAHVLAVGATDDTGARADFSNHGSWVRVSAPGVLMWSCLCTNYEIDYITQFIYMLFFAYDGANPYMEGDGTSFSAPMVSGIAGLVHSHFPTLTPDEIANRLIATGDVLSPADSLGPRVNAYRALTQVAAAPGATPGGLGLSAARPNPFRSRTSLTFTLAAPGRARLVVCDLGGRVVRTLVDADLPAGEKKVVWDGADPSGQPVDSGIYFARLEAGGTIAARKIALIR